MAYFNIKLMVDAYKVLINTKESQELKSLLGKDFTTLSVNVDKLGKRTWNNLKKEYGDDIQEDNTLTHTFKVWGMHFGYNLQNNLQNNIDNLNNMLKYASIYIILHNRMLNISYGKLIREINNISYNLGCTNFLTGDHMYGLDKDLDMNMVKDVLFNKTYKITIYYKGKFKKEFYNTEILCIIIKLQHILGNNYPKEIRKSLPTHVTQGEYIQGDVKIVITL